MHSLCAAPFSSGNRQDGTDRRLVAGLPTRRGLEQPVVLADQPSGTAIARRQAVYTFWSYSAAPSANRTWVTRSLAKRRSALFQRLV